MTQSLCEAWLTYFFMMNNDEISKNAIALTANEPNLIEIVCLTIHMTQYLYKAWSMEDL